MSKNDLGIDIVILYVLVAVIGLTLALAFKNQRDLTEALDAAYERIEGLEEKATDLEEGAGKRKMTFLGEMFDFDKLEEGD